MASEILPISDEFDQLIVGICRERLDYRSLGEWTAIKEFHTQILPSLKEESDDLRGKIKGLAEPALQYAIYLDPSPASERDVIIGIGDTRLEVRVSDEVRPQARTLVPGQFVAINKERNVVAIRNEHVTGEIAEVVNILKADREAEVLKVHADESSGTPQLSVRWQESQELVVSCREELIREGVQAGHYVLLDADHQRAISRAKPRLHVKSGGSDGTVVEVTDKLAALGVRIGDIVRIEPSLKFAFEKLPSYETGGLTLEKVPDVTYEDIGGLDEQIEQIYDAIELPYLYKDQFEYYQLSRPKGILLYGPPGCGKTMIAKAVASSLTRNIRKHLLEIKQHIIFYQRFRKHPEDPNLAEEFRRAFYGGREFPVTILSSTQQIQEYLKEFLARHDIDIERLDVKLLEINTKLDAKDGVRSFFLNVKGPELLDKYVGETEHRIRKIFEEARRSSSYYTPVIIFFDEMEAMFRTRGSGRSSDVETTIVPQFLSEIDGVESSEHLIIIGASNRQDMIDPAILRPKRLDVKIKIDRPSSKSAQDIFAMYLLPSLPLSVEELTTQQPVDKQGEVIFRSTYPRPANELQPVAKHARDVNMLGAFLPEGCDLRLARNLYLSNLDELEKMPPRVTVREALSRLEKDSPQQARLCLLKPEVEVGGIVRLVKQLHEKYDDDQEFHQLVEKYIQLEWLAESLIVQAVALLYSTSSMIDILMSNGKHHPFPLKDFMSGAIISNIVDRAKRFAIKRILVNQLSLRQGIYWDDLYRAIKQEFEENSEQLAHHKLFTEMGKIGEEIQHTRVLLESGTQDPWSEEKPQTYKEVILNSF